MSAQTDPLSVAPNTFRNAIAEGADPWVIFYEGSYYWAFSATGRGVYVFRSDRLTSLGERHLVWEAPADGPYSREVWAPELHHLDGQWYLYTTASDGNNANHRVMVLESESGGPVGPYRFKAELYTGDEHATQTHNRWAIDATVFTHREKRYVTWSGWEKTDPTTQWLYIAELLNPWTTAGNRVRICANDDFLWERVTGSEAGPGLNEAPQILQRNGRTFLIFSGCGSWETFYKLGMLELIGADPLLPASWKKFPQPVFSPTEKTWGVGHACFTQSPDGTEDWMVYHAKENRDADWKRSVFVQPFTFVEGRPTFDRPVARGEPLALPSNQRHPQRFGGNYTSDFAHGWGEWDYYGHHDLISVKKGQLHLGDFDEHLAMFRAGEKLLLRDRICSDYTITATITLDNDATLLGLLLGVGEPSLGFGRHAGIFVGIEAGAVVVSRWQNGERAELHRQPEPIRSGIDYELAIKVSRTTIEMLSPWRFVLTDFAASAENSMIGILLERGRGVVDRVRVETHYDSPHSPKSANA